MNEETFLAAIREDPTDEVAPLALADFFDEDGQHDRAELLRLTRRLRATAPAESDDLRKRVVELLAADVRPVVVERHSWLGMRFALVPPGRFLMGSPPEEEGRDEHEQLHEVTITRPYWLGVFAVTQGQYADVMGNNPSHFRRDGPGKGRVRRRNTDDFPVEDLSWEDAARFASTIDSLARRSADRQPPPGYVYRLPTEAEWEFACRGGGIAREPFCLKVPSPTLHSSEANVDGTHDLVADKGPNLRRTCKVGSYEPNPLGLYDMHGNVWEWCNDWFDADYFLTGPAQDPPGPATGNGRVYRGGSWMHFGHFCRAAFRSGYGPSGHVSRLGFRLALAPGPVEPRAAEPRTQRASDPS
jgi:uncharacterized protein (TIGR02996 family)